MASGIEVFFYPESVALIGASGKPGAFSHEMLRNLARSYKGRLYAVNPKYKEILGVPSYPSIQEIPDEIDLAVIAVRAERVPHALQEAGEKGVKGAVIVAGGFAETGEEGARLQEEVASIARRYGIRVVGPNCIGIYNAVNGLDTFFLPPEKMRRPPRGYIAVVSQSGAFLTTMMDWLATESVGIVKAINIGNKVDVDEAEIIEYYASQEYVKTIMVYIEGVNPGRGRPLVESIRKAREEGKKVVVLKGGKTSYGSKAARSHTAALAGDYQVFSSAIREAGAVEAPNPTEFVDSAKALANIGHLRAGKRVLVLTNAGGPGVLATDELASRGLEAPRPPKSVRERLSRVLPPIVSLENPIDLTGQATDDDYRIVLDTVLEDDSWFDSMVIIAPVQPATMTIKVADIIADAIWRSKKAGVVMTIGAEYGDLVKEYLDSRGIPTYPLPDRASATLHSLVQASRQLCPLPKPGKPPREALAIIEKARAEGRTKLLEHEALLILQLYGIEVARYCIATTPSEAEECASRLGERIVAKVVSPDIVHKSDVGGVLIGVDRSDAAKAFKAIIENVRSKTPGARITGVLFQDQARPGLEVIIGGRRDPAFGPIVLFGLGGVMVEVLRDFALGLAPTSRCQASRMIESIRARRLLEGYRGSGPRDKESLARHIVAVSRIISEIPGITEIDVNPLIVYEKGSVAVDARILLG